jgi:hypothetical protein
MTSMRTSRFCLLLPVWALLCLGARAQTDFHDYNSRFTGEVGVEGGLAEYYGDLHTTMSLRSAKATAGIFYRRLFNEYLGASVHAHFASLGYSDAYNTDTFRHTRNLSFDTNVWDFSLQGDFNFFRFVPGSLTHRFTPYFTLGVGAFHFDPYAWYHDQKYYLQPLGTEGQGSPLYPKRKPYSLWALEVPMGVGVRYNLNRSWNISCGVTYHFTATDYLDDVSTTYAGGAAFPPGVTGKQTVVSVLQDRSDVYGKPLGEAGRQRGDSGNKDAFMGIEISLSYLFETYSCPVF